MKTTKTKSAIPKGGNDCIMTPNSLALAIVEHFKPTGRCMEPCAGDGAFAKAFYTLPHVRDNIENITLYEISDGFDFLNSYPDQVSWIITNPPWSKFLAFLKHSMEVADNIVFLAYANGWFVKSRINAMEAAGFHFREFAYVSNPKKPWPQMGLQMAAVHISREPGNCIFTKIDWKP